MTVLGALIHFRTGWVPFESAAVSIVPAIPVALIWWPDYSVSGIPGMNVLFAVVGFFLVVELGRRRGLDVERSLEKRWEGSQAIALLRHHDSTIPQHQKRRYRTALQKLIPDWVSPSAEQEVSDPKAANAVYDEAVRWLLRQTSDVDRFPVLARSSARYHFRLNMLGLRPLIIAFGTAAVILGISRGSHAHSVIVENATTLSAILTIVIPVLTAREVDIRKAATEYAASLFETLEILAYQAAPKS